MTAASIAGAVRPGMSPDPDNHRILPMNAPRKETAMRTTRRRITTFIFAAALAAFASACTNSPFGPDQNDDGDTCYVINGHIVCAGDS